MAASYAGTFGDLLILVADGSGGHGAGGQSAGAQGGNSNSQQGNQGTRATENSPNWASQELADIGRLNVIESPDSVLQRSIDNVEEYDASIYSKSVTEFVNSRTSLDQIIDSPVTNVAVLKEYWVDGTIALDNVTPASFVDFSAITIGTAIDKETKVTEDIVEALATIVGIELTDKQVTDITLGAEAVRDKVVEVHDAS